MTDTPVTKLDSVERLTEKYISTVSTKDSFSFLNFGSETQRLGFINRPYIQQEMKILRAALTEMWDLSRREALREAAIWLEKMAEVTIDPIKAQAYLTGALGVRNEKPWERLAVEEGTKHE
jgi:hypothetical protein